jgi:biopolymer transport protein TolR
MAFGCAARSVKSEINVTPLVDVVLVLLIIFMVITPLLQRGKPVELPSALSVSEAKREPVCLSITADGQLWIEKAAVPLQGLRDALTAALAARPGASLLLKADRSLDYRLVRQVLGELAKSKLPGLSLAVNLQQEGR